MNITYKAQVRKSERHAPGKGFYICVIETTERNETKVIQPGQNFRKSASGARKFANTCANNYATDARKFGNVVTVVEA
jgi:hypothetical protein